MVLYNIDAVPSALSLYSMVLYGIALYSMLLYGVILHCMVLYNIDAVPSAPTLSSGAQIEAAEFDNNPETSLSLSAIYIYWISLLQS